MSHRHLRQSQWQANSRTKQHYISCRLRPPKASINSSSAIEVQNDKTQERKIQYVRRKSVSHTSRQSLEASGKTDDWRSNSQHKNAIGIRNWESKLDLRFHLHVLATSKQPRRLHVDDRAVCWTSASSWRRTRRKPNKTEDCVTVFVTRQWPSRGVMVDYTSVDFVFVCKLKVVVVFSLNDRIFLLLGWPTRWCTKAAWPVRKMCFVGTEWKEADLFCSWLKCLARRVARKVQRDECICCFISLNDLSVICDNVLMVEFLYCSRKITKLSWALVMTNY